MGHGEYIMVRMGQDKQGERYRLNHLMRQHSDNASVIFTDPPVDSLSYIGELDTPIV